MNKLLLIVLTVIVITGCAGIYSEEAMMYSRKHLRLTIDTYGPSNLHIIFHSRTEYGHRVEINQYGHCYVFGTVGIPDTSSSKGIIMEDWLPIPSGNNFTSKIPYDSINHYIQVRGFIVFADSLIYSDVLCIKLNHYEE